MIIDSNLVLSDAQAVTATAASTNVIDLGASREYVGVDGDLYFNVIVGGTGVDDSGHTGTVVISLQTHDDASFSTGTRTVVTLETLVVEDLLAGRTLSAILPPYMGTGAGHEEQLGGRYLRAYYTVANMTLSGSTFDAWIGTHPASVKRRVVN